jgi:hypothetical protein
MCCLSFSLCVGLPHSSSFMTHLHICPTRLSPAPSPSLALIYTHINLGKNLDTGHCIYECLYLWQILEIREEDRVAAKKVHHGGPATAIGYHRTLHAHIQGCHQEYGPGLSTWALREGLKGGREGWRYHVLTLSHEKSVSLSISDRVSLSA